MSVASSEVLIWFRNDLRLRDNPALCAAAKAGKVSAVYVLSDEDEAQWALGGASRWWLHHSLVALEKSLKDKSMRLVIRKGHYINELRDVVKNLGATQVYFNRRYEPHARKNDTHVTEELLADGVLVESFNGNLLREPHETLNKSKEAYKVFTPFWRARLAQGHDLSEANLPRNIQGSTKQVRSLKIADLDLLPKINWDKEFYEHWQPGEEGAHKRLKTFAKKIAAYDKARDVPGEDGTSRMGGHLHFGEISPRQLWNALVEHSGSRIAAPYLRQLGWREFSVYLLYHFPHAATGPLKQEFTKMVWKKSAKNLRIWQKGLTGYPIVDAGMRQLWRTGWMHNRVRMIVASFLIKDLLIDWKEGEAWFWDTLVDADLPNNAQGWQWTAGCGADASPFFRVFNPVLQGEKFDADGEYIRQYVPELAKLPKKYIHKPWDAPAAILSQAVVQLGKTYPARMVDHAKARLAALDMYDNIK